MGGVDESSGGDKLGSGTLLRGGKTAVGWTRGGKRLEWGVVPVAVVVVVVAEAAREGAAVDISCMRLRCLKN